MITINGIQVTRLRIFTPARGVWTADVSGTPDDATTAPTSGSVVIKVDDATLVGTIDETHAARFADRWEVRVIGGAGGWRKPVGAQHYHSDAGVPAVQVYSAAATEVGEVVAGATGTLGVDFARAAAPASEVFGDAAWYVDGAGITQLGSRPTVAAGDDLTLLAYFPRDARVELAAESLVLPGTTISDARLSGGLTLGDVDQIYDGKRARVTAWLAAATPAARIAGALRAITDQSRFLKIYRYQCVSGTHDAMTLRALDTGVPDLQKITTWTGVGGITSELVPGAEVLVEFIGGDPTRPILRGVSSSADALSVSIGGGAHFLVPAEWAIGLAGLLSTFAGACSGSTTDPILKAAAIVLAGALPALPTPATLKTKAT